MSRKYNEITEEVLRDLYWDQGLSLVAIADKFGCGDEAIRRRMIKYGVPRRGSSGGDSGRPSIQKPAKEELCALYSDKGLSLASIAEHFDCSAPTVYNWFKSYDIPRTKSESGKLSALTKEKLYDLYWVEELSMQKIADMFGGCAASVRERMEKYGIQRRTRSESRRGDKHPLFGVGHTVEARQKMSEARTKPRIPKEILEDMYYKKEMSAVDIAEELGCLDSFVYMCMREYGMEHREYKGDKSSRFGIKHSEETRKKMSDNHADVSGDKNPNWQDGASFEPYCPKFNNAFKEKIRDRFNRTCFLCPITEKENGKKLNVHHVQYNKDCLCDGSDCEFVPLCNKCHTKTNFNREYWKNLIMDKLKEKNISQQSLTGFRRSSGYRQQTLLQDY